MVFNIDPCAECDGRGEHCRAGQTVQFTMGGCCSKCGVYTTDKSPETRGAATGDTPKLSRLQHKDSFSNGKAQANGTAKNGGVGHEMGQADSGAVATPSSGDTCER